jgi:hypothetical protein
MTFFKLSKAHWEAGFGSKQAIYEWVAASPMFLPRRLRMTNGRNYGTMDRVMFQDFLTFVSDSSAAGQDQEGQDVVRAALEAFGKTAEYDELLRNAEIRLKIRARLNGKLVMEWTGIKNGPEVGKIISNVKANLGEDRIISISPEALSDYVRQLALAPTPQFDER